MTRLIHFLSVTVEMVSDKELGLSSIEILSPNLDKPEPKGFLPRVTRIFTNSFFFVLIRETCPELYRRVVEVKGSWQIESTL